MSELVDQVLKRRLVFVTGKGGVGKTTVSAALAVEAARRGIDSVVVELGEKAELPELLGVPEPNDPSGGRHPVRLRDRLYSFCLDPEVALTEYLEVQLVVAALVRAVVRTAGFQRLMDAAPGWRDLIRLGKLWHLESRTTAAGTPRWPLLIVDAPATGHGLSMLSIPQVVVETIRVGPLHRHAGWVDALMRDAERTVVLPVTLLEELPVRETRQLVAGIRELGMAVGPVVVNRVRAPLALPDSELLIRAWDGLGACELSGSQLRKLLDGARARSAMREDLSNALSELALGGRLDLSERDERPPDLLQLAEELGR